MRFSVIIPVYNSELYIDQCINSILKQSYHDFEVILVDDGSTDNSPVICDSYGELDCRVRVVHQNNQGQSVARNTGLEYALGDYVIFIDSDDWVITDDFLEKLSLKELENFIISAANSEEKNFYRTLFNLKLQLEQEKVIDQPLF